MALFSRKKSEKRNNSNIGYLLSDAGFNVLCSDGYTSLDKNPEILTACEKIAELVSSMTIHLMSNTEKGDIRITNELSRLVDIEPNSYMTRRTWMESIVMNLLLYGAGNSIVVPRTSNGLLQDLIPIEAGRVSFSSNAGVYKIMIDGEEHDPADLLHFVYHPDKNNLWKGQGITVAVKDVANNLKQAQATKKGFLSNRFNPSLIVKVDATVDEFGTPEGRDRLVKEYTEGVESGKPWMIPGDMLDVKEIRPLTLADLAINDSVVLDKKTVASIVGVPAFVLGVGEFNSAEWNNFISSKIKAIAEIIEQEMTKKLLLSPKWYWKLNIQSLYSYDLSTTASVFNSLCDRGIVTGNEVRDRIGMSPLEGLDELRLLENYIPADMSGNQKKLIQEGEE